MIQRIARWAGRNLPTSLADIGLRVYTKTYASIFASRKKEYNLGDFNMILDQSESIMMVSRRFRQYESDVSELISNRIGRGSTYIDIGSNKGYHVLEAATIVGKGGIVYSFEPNPNNFSDLQNNIELNGFKNILRTKKAVYEKKGTFSFGFGGKSGLGSVSQDGDIEVETITLDEFLNEEKVSLSKIDCVKIDVEGGEASVLAGMTNFLSESDGCTIVIEVHSDADIQRMSQILNENGCCFEKFNEYWIVET